MNSDSKQTKTKHHRLLLIASAFFLPLLVVGIAEISLRTADVGFGTELLTPCTVQGRSAACNNLFFAARFFPPGMIQTPLAFSIPEQKPSRTIRIFVLGESAAMGDPDPAYSFSRYLQVMLRERYPSMRFEIVNTGMVGINSHVLLPMAKELAKYKPDIFIIYSGNNEVVGPYGPGTALASTWGMQLPVIRTSMFLHSTRTAQLLTKLGTPKREWRGMEMFLDKQVRADLPLMKYTYANFEQNLRDTVAVARRSGARVLISTVATNTRDCAPFASLHRSGLSEDSLKSWSSLVQKGVDLENAGSYSEALKYYLSAADIDGEYAELQFRIARCFSALGDHRQANQRYILARDLDTLRFRADSRINQLNASVANTSPGVELVDADAVLANASKNGTIGSDLVYEHVHLTPEGNYLLARALFQQIVNAAPFASETTTGTVPSEAECEQLLAFTGFDRVRVTKDVFQRIQKPPFTNQLNHSDQLLRLTTLTEKLDENPVNTVTQYKWAIARNPEDRMLHYGFGVFLFGYSHAAAAEQLVMARPWDGFPMFLPDGTPVQ